MSHEIRTPLTAILGFSDILREEVPADLRSSPRRSTRAPRACSARSPTSSTTRAWTPTRSERRRRAVRRRRRRRARRSSCSARSPRRRQGLALHFSSDASEYVATQSATAWAAWCEPRRQRRSSLPSAARSRSRSRHARATSSPSASATRAAASRRPSCRSSSRPFTQESDGHDRSHEGTGLGLLVTKRLVDLMGGTDPRLEPTGEGTLFEVSIPRVAPGAIASFGAPGEIASPTVWQGAPAPALPHLGNVKSPACRPDLCPAHAPTSAPARPGPGRAARGGPGAARHRGGRARRRRRRRPGRARADRHSRRARLADGGALGQTGPWTALHDATAEPRRSGTAGAARGRRRRQRRRARLVRPSPA